MKNSIILAIDPGFDRVGWAIGSSSSSHNTKIIDFGCIQTNKADSFFDRYQSIINQLEVIVADHQPQELAIENIYFSKNTSSAMRVSEARGIVIGICLKHRLAIFEYSPNQIKVAVTGDGRASKLAMEKMIRLQFSLTPEKIIDDTIDAIGILLTHSVTRKMGR